MSTPFGAQSHRPTETASAGVLAGPDQPPVRLFSGLPASTYAAGLAAVGIALLAGRQLRKRRAAKVRSSRTARLAGLAAPAAAIVTAGIKQFRATKPNSKRQPGKGKSVYRRSRRG